MVLTGEVGAGKTTLLQALLASVDPASTVTAHISAARLDAETLSERLSEALGLPPQPDPLARRDALLAALTSGLRATLLVIDEAQHLAPSALDLLETLANTTALAPARLQICLVGQPELRILLNAAKRSGFRALIGVDRHLGPLEQAEVRLYVEHRLHRAGWTGRPEFEDAAFTEIFIFTAGNPRRINLLCNSLMLCACLKKQQRIDAPAVTWAAAAMREDSFQGAPDLLDLGSHFEHRPTLTEAFEPDPPELEAATRREDASRWSCPSCGGLNASTATRCWTCEAARPSLDAGREPPGETSRAPEDAMTAHREAVHVEAASTHAANDPASVTAAEPPGDTIGAPEFALTAPPDAVHADATSPHAADDPGRRSWPVPPPVALRWSLIVRLVHARLPCPPRRTHCATSSPIERRRRPRRHRASIAAARRRPISPHPQLNRLRHLLVSASPAR
jgi:type II secretory pathway predicted ATPase ExeA